MEMKYLDVLPIIEKKKLFTTGVFWKNLIIIQMKIVFINNRQNIPYKKTIDKISIEIQKKISNINIQFLYT